MTHYQFAMIATWFWAIVAGTFTLLSCIYAYKRKTGRAVLWIVLAVLFAWAAYSNWQLTFSVPGG